MKTRMSLLDHINRARWIAEITNQEDRPVADITIEIVNVTPAMAATWLATNNHNRHLKRSVVLKLAGAMERGEWHLNGETIKFNSGSGLVDGQHRLTAIVESKKTIPMVVVHELNSSAQETVDIGVKRSTADLLTLRGESHASDLGAALVQLWRYRNGLSMGNSGGEANPTPQQQLVILDNEPGLRESIKAVSLWRERLRYSRGLAAALHLIFSELSPDDANYFMDRVADGQGLVEGDAMLTLRESLLRDLAAIRRMVPIRRAAITIRAWNAYRDGEKLARLQWNPGGHKPDPFPVPH